MRLLLVVVVVLCLGCMEAEKEYLEVKVNETVSYASDVCNCTPAYQRGYDQGVLDTIKKFPTSADKGKK